MKPILKCAIGGLLLASAGLAQADICALDDAPAASLLYPYFEVDLGSPAGQGVTTLISVRNDSNETRLAQVNLWGSFNRAAMGFQVYLPARSTRRINLDDILRNGILPSSGAAISPHSPFDTVPTNAAFPGCNNTSDPALGPPVAAQLTPMFLADVQARLTGHPSFTTGYCYGLDQGDDVARGFVTVDVVTSCSLELPDNSIYWLAGIPDTANVLSGSFDFVDLANNFAQGGRAVALEAGAPGAFAPGEVTFFGRFVNGTAMDAREPLPGRWAVEFANGGPTSESADLLVWRGAPPTTNGSACFGPNWYPLGHYWRQPFDTVGDTPLPPFLFPGEVPPYPTPIALATQRFPSTMIDDTLQADVQAGSGVLALHTTAAGFPMGLEGQAWVGVISSTEGRFSHLVNGSVLDSFCAQGKLTAARVDGPLALNPSTPDFLFRDGFED